MNDSTTSQVTIEAHPQCSTLNSSPTSEGQVQVKKTPLGRDLG